MHHNIAWYSLKPVPLNQNDRDELMQVLSVWRRFDMKKFKYQLSCQMENFKHLLADFDKAEKEFVEWKFSRESSQLISSTPNDQENSYLAGLYMYQRKNLAERLKISESICEQFINLFNDLPNPTPCLKRFKEDFDMTNSIRDQNQGSPPVQHATNRQFHEKFPNERLYQPTTEEAREMSETPTTEPEPDVVYIDGPSPHTFTQATRSQFDMAPNSTSNHDHSNSDNNDNNRSKPEENLFGANCSCQWCDHFKNQDLNTSELVTRVDALRLKDRISREVLGRELLGVSGVTMRYILNSPDPWDKLRNERKNRYRKLHAWCCFVESGGRICCPRDTKLAQIHGRLIKNRDFRRCPMSAKGNMLADSSALMINVDLKELARSLSSILEKYEISSGYFANRRLHISKIYYDELMQQLASGQEWSAMRPDDQLVLTKAYAWTQASHEQLAELKCQCDTNVHTWKLRSQCAWRTKYHGEKFT